MATKTPFANLTNVKNSCCGNAQKQMCKETLNAPKSAKPRKSPAKENLVGKDKAAMKPSPVESKQCGGACSKGRSLRKPSACAATPSNSKKSATDNKASCEKARRLVKMDPKPKVTSKCACEKGVKSSLQVPSKKKVAATKGRKVESGKASRES